MIYTHLQMKLLTLVQMIYTYLQMKLLTLVHMIYTHLQMKLFIPIFKCFEPIFIHVYGWCGNIHYFIVDGEELNQGINYLNFLQLISLYVVLV